jgi:hypothetical protein
MNFLIAKEAIGAIETCKRYHNSYCQQRTKRAIIAPQTWRLPDLMMDLNS